ncbi:transcription elongation factor GreA [Candidatus Parcubacteria bacterium]|nr:MAG: transcription elongation factor GreA [Candidatus Parcubacteria bacterium]
MTEHNILTSEAYEELKKELEYLKTTKRSEIAQALEYARSLGDLRENAEYQEAREAQAALEERIRVLEETLRNAQVVVTKAGRATQEIIGMGSRVRVRKNGGEEKEFVIVSPHEADTLTGKISYESPLGSALMGRKVGEVVEIEAPAGVIRYEIIAIA